LDLYQPNPAPGSPVPTVVFFHSGAWVTGDSSFAPASLTGLAEQAIVGHGWIFASANYRLAPKDTWPAQIEDAKCAVRYLRANAATLHIDAAHIGAMGSSAGAQLASLLGLAGPAAGFDVGEHVDQSSAVQAVVDQCGPADLTTSDWAASGAALAFASTVFGENFGRNTALLAQASPVSFVAPGAPPFLIQQGAADTTVYPVQSQELASRLQAAGDSATLEMVQNAGHEFAPAGPTPISPSIAQLATDATSFFFRALGT
jgi:acetyl esterase/lipase